MKYDAEMHLCRDISAFQGQTYRGWYIRKELCAWQRFAVSMRMSKRCLKPFLPVSIQLDFLANAKWLTALNTPETEAVSRVIVPWAPLS